MPTQYRERHTPQSVQVRARELRHEMTPAEQELWKHLRDRRLDGLKFRRQTPLGPYIADFYCAEHRLVVEIDGPVHDNQVEQDQDRTEQFLQHGYRVIRFTNQQTLEYFDEVLEKIKAACRD